MNPCGAYLAERVRLAVMGTRFPFSPLPPEPLRVAIESAVAAGELRQLRNGRAGAYRGSYGVSSGNSLSYWPVGQYVCPKPTGVVLLDGGKAFWDRSERKITYRKNGDRDFLAGSFVGDAASADESCVVNFGVFPHYDYDLLREGTWSAPIGTYALGGNGVGFGYPLRLGGSASLQLSAENQAQKVELMAADGFVVAAKPIVEIGFRVVDSASGSNCDFNIGIANGTSTTDADAITESVFFHIDGGALTINAESDDGTTEVNATDTTKTFTAGSAVANRKEFWIDMSDPADIQLYVDGVNVLPSSVFKLDAGTGPMGLMAHLEKSSSTATGLFVIDALRARYKEQ